MIPDLEDNQAVTREGDNVTTIRTYVAQPHDPLNPFDVAKRLLCAADRHATINHETGALPEIGQAVLLDLLGETQNGQKICLPWEGVHEAMGNLLTPVQRRDGDFMARVDYLTAAEDKLCAVWWARHHSVQKRAAPPLPRELEGPDGRHINRFFKLGTVAFKRGRVPNAMAGRIGDAATNLIVVFRAARDGAALAPGTRKLLDELRQHTRPYGVVINENKP